jgi:DNA-binding SARP family transcriptional activator
LLDDERISLPACTAVAGEAEALIIQMLGGFAISVGPHPIDESAWHLRKTRSLLKFLALAPQRRVHREQIMDVLWPEQDADAAANNLHKTMYMARRILEPGLPRNGNSSYLQLRRDFVALTLPAGSWIDVDAFQLAAQAARLQHEALAYEEALRLYTGDLLPEDRSEDWVFGPREDLRALYCALWIELAGLQEQRDALNAAIHALRQAVAADPVYEEAHLQLMRLLVRSGQRHLALRRYQRLREALRKDLNAEPDSQLQAFYERILRGEAPSEPYPTRATRVAEMLPWARERGGPRW